MKRKPYKILFFVLFFLGMITYDSLKKRERGKEAFRLFYESNLNGRLVSIQVSLGIVYITLDNDSSEYAFFPYVDDMNENHLFSTTARIGDSIVKRAYSDTLRLIKSNREYLYAFKKEE